MHSIVSKVELCRVLWRCVVVVITVYIRFKYLVFTSLSERARTEDGENSQQYLHM